MTHAGARRGDAPATHHRRTDRVLIEHEGRRHRAVGGDFIRRVRGADQIASTAGDLAAGNLGKRAEYFPGPMADLTTNFNGMAARLEEQFDE